MGRLGALGFGVGVVLFSLVNREALGFHGPTGLFVYPAIVVPAAMLLFAVISYYIFPLSVLTKVKTAKPEKPTVIRVGRIFHALMVIPMVGYLHVVFQTYMTTVLAIAGFSASEAFEDKANAVKRWLVTSSLYLAALAFVPWSEVISLFSYVSEAKTFCASLTKGTTRSDVQAASTAHGFTYSEPKPHLMATITSEQYATTANCRVVYLDGKVHRTEYR